MAGTSTIPTIWNGTAQEAPTYRSISIKLIDYDGNFRTVTIKAKADATAQEIQNLADSMQACTNASSYELHDTAVYTSKADKSQAVEAVWEGIEDNIVVQYKDDVGNSRRWFVPAPSNDVFVEGQDNPDPTNANLLALMVDVEQLLPAEYDAYGIRFTSRRQINEQTKL